MITKALEKLRPNAQWILAGDTYEGLDWRDTEQSKPTEDEVNLEIIKLNAEAKKDAYKQLRKTEYDKLNQLEMLYDDMVNGTTTWIDAITAIKKKFPKAEQ